MNSTKVNSFSDAIRRLDAVTFIFHLFRVIKSHSTCYQSMIGHCLGAAGGLEAIATLKGVKAIKTGWLHPTNATIDQFV